MVHCCMCAVTGGDLSSFYKEDSDVVIAEGMGLSICKVPTTVLPGVMQVVAITCFHATRSLRADDRPHRRGEGQRDRHPACQ